MALIDSDAFDVSDSSTVGDGGWTERRGDWDNISNKARSPSNPSGNQNVIKRSTYGTADYTFEADVTCNNTDPQWGSGIAARMVDYSTDDADMYYFGIQGSSGTSWIWSRASGSWNQLGSYSISGFNNTTTYRLKISVQGTTIKGFIDGVERISVTDSTLAAAGTGCLALVYVSTNAGRWDNMEANDFSVASASVKGQYVISQAVHRANNF